MWLFLSIAGGIFVGLILFVVVVYLLIRWKLRGLAKWFADSLQEGLAQQVPPFRIKLENLDNEEEEDWLSEEHQEEFTEITAELEQSGFTRISDYRCGEGMFVMRAMVDTSTGTYAMVYCHLVAGVFAEVSRVYEDGTSWTYSKQTYHGMDVMPTSHQKYLPEKTIEEIVQRFRADAPEEDIVRVEPEQFAAWFEKLYAKEMDWRMDRGGITEDEILRVSTLKGNEITDAQVRQIKSRWRQAINFFQSQRALTQYRKEAELDSYQWDHLQGRAVVVFDKMQAEDLLGLVDEEYAYNIEDEDDEEVKPKQREKWSQQLGQLEDALTRAEAPAVFRDFLELHQNNGRQEYRWEYQGAIREPILADIWIRDYVDDYD